MTPAQANAIILMTLACLSTLALAGAVGVVLARRGYIVPDTVQPDSGDYDA